VITCSTVVGPTPEVVEVVLLSPNKGSEVVSNHVSVVANGAIALVEEVVTVGGVGVGLVAAEVLAGGGGDEGSRLRWRLEEARVEGGGGGRMTAAGAGGEKESSNGS
jgi:hypothetical protein